VPAPDVSDQVVVIPEGCTFAVNVAVPPTPTFWQVALTLPMFTTVAEAV
jgi:hypothetical protein